MDYAVNGSHQPSMVLKMYLGCTYIKLGWNFFCHSEFNVNLILNDSKTFNIVTIEEGSFQKSNSLINEIGKNEKKNYNQL